MRFVPRSIDARAELGAELEAEAIPFRKDGEGGGGGGGGPEKEEISRGWWRRWRRWRAQFVTVLRRWRGRW